VDEGVGVPVAVHEGELPGDNDGDGSADTCMPAVQLAPPSVLRQKPGVPDATIAMPSADAATAYMDAGSARGVQSDPLPRLTYARAALTMNRAAREPLADTTLWPTHVIFVTGGGSVVVVKVVSAGAVAE
jgi:hypothetical protein